jgi:hypothetical protein
VAVGVGFLLGLGPRFGAQQRSQDQSRGESHEPHEPDRGVHVVVAVPGDRVRLPHYGGGQLAVAYRYGRLGDRRDLGYLKRRSARGPSLGRILIAEVPE